MRTNYIEANFKENLDSKNQHGNKKLPDPVSFRKAASKNCIDNLFDDRIITKNTNLVDLNGKNLKNVRFIKVNSIPTLEEQVTPKTYVDQALSDVVEKSSSLRLDHNQKLKLDEQDFIVVKSSLTLPKTILILPNKS